MNLNFNTVKTIPRPIKKDYVVYHFYKEGLVHGPYNKADFLKLRETTHQTHQWDNHVETGYSIALTTWEMDRVTLIKSLTEQMAARLMAPIIAIEYICKFIGDIDPDNIDEYFEIVSDQYKLHVKLLSLSIESKQCLLYIDPMKSCKALKDRHKELKIVQSLKNERNKELNQL